MNPKDGHLFNKRMLKEKIREVVKSIFDHIEGIDGNALLNMVADDLCSSIEDRYRLHVPSLLEERISHDIRETVIPNAIPPMNTKGTIVSVFVPFEGDPELFSYCPSKIICNPPEGEIYNHEVILTYSGTYHDASAIETMYRRDVAEIKDGLQRIDEDIAPFNASIKEAASKLIETRRQKLLKDLGLSAALGIPLRRNVNCPPTFTVPITRKKIQINIPTTRSTAYEPEPVLDWQKYEEILAEIINMAHVIERNPKAFTEMKEEDLRWIFLIPLNAHYDYEGHATGEAFNFDGKTDILIQEKGRNVFIAECKVWDGPASLTGAIDQLLRYTTWRDTKTAVILFNRNRDFTSVISKIPEIVRNHANYKRDVPFEYETGFRCTIRHRDDANRELFLTVLAFEVPIRGTDGASAPGG